MVTSSTSLPASRRACATWPDCASARAELRVASLSFIGSGITYEGKVAYGKFIMTMANPTTINVRAEASSDGKAYALGFEGKWTRTK